VSRDYLTKQRVGYVNEVDVSLNVVTLWGLLHLRRNVITFIMVIELSGVLFFVYTTRQRNFAFHITHEHIFLFSHAQLIGFTTTCDWL